MTQDERDAEIYERMLSLAFASFRGEVNVVRFWPPRELHTRPPVADILKAIDRLDARLRGLRP